MDVFSARLVAVLPGFHDGRRIDVTAYPGKTLLSVRADDALSVHELATLGEAMPAVFPAPWASCPTAVSPSGELAVFCGTHALRAVDSSGRTRWEHRHACWAWRCQEPHRDEAEYEGDADHRSTGSGSAHFSADGRLIWAHVRTGITIIDAHKAAPTHAWLVLDAATGEVLAQADVETYAHASDHIAHPDPSRMGLDGDPLLWGHFDGSALHIERTTAGDIVTDADRAGEHYLTLDEGRSTMGLHRLADGGLLASLAPPPFEGVSPTQMAEDDDYQSRWQWVPRFLDATTVLAPTNESDVLSQPDRHWLVDLPSMRPRGHISYPVPIGRRLTVLGHGRWMTYDMDPSTFGLTRAPQYDHEAGRPRLWELA
ncbi:hypothetical protein [Phytomonospora endophytica]|uniref:Uncharacterized protein n=1 Tax=Phytomonospora endophytica TaxID=714109 RepID=A0A841FPK1_9ACTN|nr:hypothetical protein [Phytomonospora endophytica]MBB6034489.1 hypothetical protein [Phytomonospora endophytica]GIG70396.1 hypothetical protein Pen01_66910 [Phytomonospora endophytica]